MCSYPIINRGIESIRQSVDDINNNNGYIRGVENRLGGHLSLKEQEVVGDCVIGCAGCGAIGSNIAIALARFGFSNFILADPVPFLPKISHDSNIRKMMLVKKKY